MQQKRDFFTKMSMKVEYRHQIAPGLDCGAPRRALVAARGGYRPKKTNLTRLAEAEYHSSWDLL